MRNITYEEIEEMQAEVELLEDLRDERELVIEEINRLKSLRRKIRKFLYK